MKSLQISVSLFALAVFTVAVTGCSAPSGHGIETRPVETSTSPESNSATPSDEGCSAIQQQFLVQTASKAGTAVTPLDDPAAAGFPTFVALPDCAILWTNDKGLPTYAGLYVAADIAKFDALLASAKAGGIMAATQTPPAGTSRFELLGENTGGTTSSAGALIMFDPNPATGADAPAILVQWDRILF